MQLELINTQLSTWGECVHCNKTLMFPDGAMRCSTDLHTCTGKCNAIELG